MKKKRIHRTTPTTSNPLTYFNALVVEGRIQISLAERNRFEAEKTGFVDNKGDFGLSVASTVNWEIAKDIGAEVTKRLREKGITATYDHFDAGEENHDPGKIFLRVGAQVDKRALANSIDQIMQDVPMRTGAEQRQG